MNKTQLDNDVKFWIVGSSTATISDYSAADMTANENRYSDEIVSIILKCDGRWEFDDANFDTLPIATTALVSGQNDYEIAGGDFLNLIRLEVKNTSGNYQQLIPMSYEDKQGVAMTEWAKTPGEPHHYDKVGNSIILYPTPNYSADAGLKAYYQRPPSYFATDDTTKTPGFNPLYHRYISMGAALDYCLINNLADRIAILTQKMADIRQRITDDYSKRSRDEHLRMSTYKEDYGNEEIIGGSENSVG